MKLVRELVHLMILIYFPYGSCLVFDCIST